MGSLVQYVDLLFVDLDAMLEAKEKELGITPDPVVAAYFEAMDKMGKTNLITDIVIKALGLDVCADTVVVSEHRTARTVGKTRQCSAGLRAHSLCVQLHLNYLGHVAPPMFCCRGMPCFVE